MRNAFVKTCLDIAAEDDRLVVLLCDVWVYAFKEFADKYPTRFYNCGIREQATVSMAAGLSSQGLIPVVSTITPFLLERAYEQIKIAKLGVGNVKLVGLGGPKDYLSQGPSHQCVGDRQLMDLLGIKSYIPSTPEEFSLMFRETYQKNEMAYIRLTIGK